MDWLLFFSSTQLRREALLIEELKRNGKRLDLDTVDGLVLKALESGYKLGVSKFVVNEEVDNEWSKFFKQQKNLGSF